MVISPTWGHLTFSQMVEKIGSFVEDGDPEDYRFIVGTDSQVFQGPKALFVSAVIVHRIGKGAIYFYDKHLDIRKFGLEERMFTEVSHSLQIASRLLDEIQEKSSSLCTNLPEIEIHIDVGHTGKTKELVNAVVGMVKGSGFSCQTKPHACGASTVADRYTKTVSIAV